MDPLIDQFGLSFPKFAAQVIIFVIVFFILNKKAFGPIMAMLEQRRQRIADGEAKLEKISRDLAEAEANARVIIDKANDDATRLIKEAGDSAKSLAEKRQQEAIHEAGQITKRSYGA